MKRFLARIKSTWWFWKQSREYPSRFVMEIHRNPYKMECWYPASVMFLKEDELFWGKNKSWPKVIKT